MTPGLFSLIFFGVAALIFLIYAAFTARGKGPILCPPYLGATKEQKEKLLSLIAEKQDQELRAKSVEELQAMLDAL